MVGKKIGKDNIYIHRSAIDELPEHLLERVRDAIKIVESQLHDSLDREFKINFVITHPDYIELVNAVAFDHVWEPVLGDRFRVTNDGECKWIPCPAKPRVLHQRYKTVRPEYKGFSIQADKNRETWYRRYFDARRMAGAGYLHKWQEMLKEIDFGA
jgi:hypothetical protein